jgi:hypothetical protein
MRILSATEAAPGRLANEDRVVTAPGFVCVLDGVTQAPTAESGCVHSPAWYVDRLSRHLLARYAAVPQRPLTELLKGAIEGVASEHADTCDLSQPATPASTVCILCVRPETVDYLVLCDTTLVLDTGTVTTVTDPRFADLITRLRAGQTGNVLASNRGYTPGKWDFINREGGYWIAAADPDAADHAVTGSIDRTGSSPVRRAALLTDGASCAVDRLGITDWPGLLDLVQQHGPDELISRVRIAERAISATANGTKPHDDATVALCLFDQEEQ